MKVDKIFLIKLAKTWKESNYGHYKKCQEKKFELSDLLEELYEKVIGKYDEDSTSEFT